MIQIKDKYKINLCKYFHLVDFAVSAKQKEKTREAK